MHSASPDHLKAEVKEGKSFFHIVKSEKFNLEEDLYKSLGLQYIEPEMREGFGEVELAREHKIPRLIDYSDLKGILHNHSTYSDGKHTLEEMALYCKELGFEYLGISDHSKTAFYANGLKEFKILEQHKEIDQLNKKLAPFRIFKGIESDILNDGELDYEDAVLASFDFIVASIHSNMKMTEEKATSRLIRAIENPYTTILGHATGRLLLKREAYPIDHKKVIDACSANNVIIEINANPRRLDMDWRWVRYAIEKGIMISINPDAHEKAGYLDMQYGVYMGRKAGLSKELTFNALSLAEIEKQFAAKKKKIL
jgi:DNA polymerase (family X)